MDNKIIAEMLTHVACCTHNDVKEVLFVGKNEFIVKELAKYKNLVITQTDKLDATHEDKFDVVLNDTISNDITNIYRSLKKDGIYCGLSENVCNTEVVKQTYTSYGKLFTIVMPYVAMTDSMQSIASFVLLSKKLHPTADIHLDKSDFLEGLHYYSSDIQRSAFEMPTFVRENLLGVIKR
ncbi:MAG: Spermine synthase [uncultured Campylobacterales bacterium]|uniref:Spermine synthase n=1 Tax=uncultured Campylobacterales bacterium TaxID=352960 RepID=A0A6S6RWB7_9BACT|nr:MAG: Spermine synthase [uncultured Campylobacterales bacterium]